MAAAAPVGLARTASKLGRHARRARRYASDIKWLLGDFIQRNWWQSARVVISGMLHLATKFMSVALLYVVVHALSEGIPRQLSHLPLPPPNSAAFLWLAVSLAFGILALSSWLRFDVRKRGIVLGREYEEYSARRVFALASRMPDPRAPVASRIAATEPMHLYIGYARHCGMAARQLVQLMPTLVSFVAGCLVMIWMDALTTAGLALLALVSTLAQYPANHRAAQASHDWERSRSEAMRRIVELFMALKRSPTPIENKGPVLDRLFAEDSVRNYIEGFNDRSICSEQAALVSRIGSHIVFCGAILLLGMDIVQGERSWAAVAAYVGVVRFTLADFVQVSTLANGFTRFHAQFTLYRRFIGDAAHAMDDPLETGGDAAPVLRVRNLVDGKSRWRPRRGSIAALLTPPLPVPSIPMMVFDAADGVEGRLTLARIDRGLIDDHTPLRALLGLSADVDEAEIARALAAFEPADDREPEAGWLDQESTAGWRQELTPARLAGLQAIAAARRGATVVAMDLAFFDELGPTWRAAAGEELAGAVLILVYQPTDVVGNLDMHFIRLGRLGEAAVLVGDGKQLVGWGPLDGPGRMPAELDVAYRAILAGPAAATTPATVSEDEEEAALVE
ncbi:MAG TPA: hypothetical protein PKA13_16185 [Geminicoccaceae bacterium]|nr:hypothetical protein [Geminicoccus sp.]HMU51315.1 hypothetical protein [Geminicoccaceae bacterium]